MATEFKIIERVPKLDKVSLQLCNKKYKIWKKFFIKFLFFIKNKKKEFTERVPKKHGDFKAFVDILFRISKLLPK